MARSETLVDELKRALRDSGHTYRDVAEHLGLSEASIKRLFSKGGLSLERVDRILEFLRMDFVDLMRRVNERREYVSQLTPAQEEALVEDPVLLVVMFLVLNRWQFDDILANYDFSEREVEKRLIRLDRLRVIELLPFNRYRLLTARNFTWRRNGPVQNFFSTRIQTEFFDSDFNRPGDELRFVGGTLTQESIFRMHGAIERLSYFFDELVERDSMLPTRQRYAVSGVFAFRPMEFSMFADHRTTRGPSLKDLAKPDLPEEAQNSRR
ncbi:MAG: helix-turn-helix transcriptional regulator [Pseudomonadota bacterium]